MQNLNQSSQKKSNWRLSLRLLSVALFLYVCYFTLPFFLIIIPILSEKYLKLSISNLLSFFGVTNNLLLNFLIAATNVVVLVASILLLIIFSYNLYYLKTESETQAIYGIFEILFAILSFVVIYLNFFSDIKGVLLLLEKMMLIYVPVYVIVRGFESIGKKYKNKKIAFFGIKFGTDEHGKAIYHTKNLLKFALFFEKHTKEINQKVTIQE